MVFSSGHALVIGVGTYQHIPHWNVPITVADAEAVAAVLRDPQRAGYPAAQVKLLAGDTASRAGVLAELARLAETLGEQDTLAVFYCGHGAYSEDGAYHLSTHDTMLTAGNKIVAGTAVSQQEFIGQLRDVKAKRVLLLLNACHVGAVAPALGDEASAGQPVPASMSSALLATGTGRIVITACKEDQLSYIGNKSLTRFTGALVDGLSGRGDVGNRNGYISAYDLYLQTYFVVHDLAEQNNQQQEPELTVLKGVGPFAVSLYRGASALGSFDESDAPPTDGAVREVRPARSRAAFTTIMGNQSMAGRDAAGRDQIRAGHDIVQAARDVIQGDTIDARGSQGLINRSSGPVEQVFGNQRNIHTGGEYNEGDIDKRRGAFVSGGTVYGPVTGMNAGTISSSYGEQSTNSADGGDNYNAGSGAPSNGLGDQSTFAGRFDGAIRNLRSTLSDVTQAAGAAAGADRQTEDQWRSLLQQLAELLQQTPASRARDAELVADRVATLVESATGADRDAEVVEFHAARLVRASARVSDAVPAVGEVTERITQLARVLGAA